MKSVDETSTSNNSKFDLFYAMAPVTFVSRMFGFFPLVLKGPTGKRKYTRSLFYTIYSLTWTLGLMTMYVVVSLLPAHIARISEKIIVLLYFQAMLFTTVLMRLTMLFYAVHAENKIANVISMIYAQDLLLRKLGTEFDYLAERKNNLIRSSMILIGIMTFCSIDFGYQGQKNTRRVHSWLIWLLPNVIHHLSVCLFMSVALSAKKRFAAVNDNLQSMIRRTECFGIFQTSNMIARQRDIARIRSLAFIHSRLCDASHKLNDIYNVEIVSGIILGFLTLLVSLFTIFKAMKDTSDVNWMQVLGSTNWALMHIFTTIYVVVTCNLTTKQAHLPAKLLYQMDPYEANGHLSNVIQLFSMQLMHHNLKFSGWGFFPLDSTLIQTIIGTVTTYLVILIQFELAET